MVTGLIRGIVWAFFATVRGMFSRMSNECYSRDDPLVPPLGAKGASGWPSDSPNASA